MSVAHEIPVVGILVYGFCQPVDAVDLPFEGEGGAAIAALRLRRLVDDGPSAARDDAVLEVVAVVVTAATVEGAARALQVQRVLLAGIPQHVAPTQLHGDAEVVGRLHERTDGGTHLIAQLQLVGLDVEVAVLLAGGICWHGQLAVDDGEGGTVFKVLARAPLYAYHARGEHGEACTTRRDDARRGLRGVGVGVGGVGGGVGTLMTDAVHTHGPVGQRTQGGHIQFQAALQHHAVADALHLFGRQCCAPEEQLAPLPLRAAVVDIAHGDVGQCVQSLALLADNVAIEIEQRAPLGVVVRQRHRVPLSVVERANRGQRPVRGVGVDHMPLGIHVNTPETGARSQRQGEQSPSLSTLHPHTDGERMDGALAPELQIAALCQLHAATHLPLGLSLASGQGIEERRRHGIEELAMATGGGVCVVLLITRCPVARTVVDGAERVHRCHIPLVDEHVHALDVGIILGGEVAARVVVHHHGHHAVGLDAGDERLHIAGELAERRLFVAALVDALVAHGEADDDVARIVARQLVVAVKQVSRVVAAYRQPRHVERIRRRTIAVALGQLLPVEPGIALVAIGTLSVAHRRAESRDAIRVGGGLKTPLLRVHVEGHVVGAAIDADVGRAVVPVGTLEIHILVAEEEHPAVVERHLLLPHRSVGVGQGHAALRGDVALQPQLFTGGTVGHCQQDKTY